MDLTDLKVSVELIGAILTAIAAIITAILVILKKLCEFWEKVLRPLLKMLVALVFGSLFYGVVIYGLLYYALTNSRSIKQPAVFIATIGIATVLISAYSLAWATGLYPWVRSWLTRESSQEHDRKIEDSQSSQD
jgi:hypothetical protein